MRSVEFIMNAVGGSWRVLDRELGWSDEYNKNSLCFPGGSDDKESSCSEGDLGWEDPLEKTTMIHSGILAWRIPWREDLGRPQSMGSWAGHDWTDFTFCCLCGVGTAEWEQGEQLGNSSRSLNEKWLWVKPEWKLQWSWKLDVLIFWSQNFLAQEIFDVRERKLLRKKKVCIWMCISLHNKAKAYFIILICSKDTVTVSQVVQW